MLDVILENYLVFSKPFILLLDSEFLLKSCPTLNTSDLIEILLDPLTYPHPVEVITTIETHISVVFLTGQYAYKLKKPVNFGFLDFSELKQRQKFCALEVTLNSRTAPELYLDVYCIVFDNNTRCHYVLPTAETKDHHLIIDYLVKMQQFDPNMVLGRLLRDSKLEFELVASLTTKITDFHKNAEKAVFNSPFGTPKVQLKPMLDNFPTLVQYCQRPINKQKISTLMDWTDQQFLQHETFLVERKKNGFVRACHGDLHLDNITLIEQQPILFDGIEFNESFRWIDVMSDFAFLLIDLDFRKQHSASYQALSLYLTQTLDYKGLYLLNFYRVYRTLVRAKITALRGLQLPDKSIQQQQVMDTAEAYIDQAYQYIQPNSSPKCIILQGVSGSGKSFFANNLLEKMDNFNAIIISSDRIRKSLFGISHKERLTGEQQTELYSAKMNKKTYDALAEYSDICLQLGFNVIIDATFLKKQHRQVFQDLAFSHQSNYYQIYIETTNQYAEQAITERLLLNNNPSDANIDVMSHQQAIIEAPTHDEHALTLQAHDLRKVFPQQIIQDYLNLPIN